MCFDACLLLKRVGGKIPFQKPNKLYCILCEAAGFVLLLIKLQCGLLIGLSIHTPAHKQYSGFIVVVNIHNRLYLFMPVNIRPT